MTNLSNIIGKPLISLYNIKLEGIVTNVLFDSNRQKAKYLIIVDETDYNSFAVAINNIYNMGQAITIKNDGYLYPTSSMDLELLGYFNPISSKVFDTNGFDFGTVTDINIDNKYNIISYILNNNIEITPQNVICFNNNLLLLSKSPKKERLSRFKQSIPQPKIAEDIKVAIQSFDQPASILAKTPNRAITNYSFLLNRMMTKTIVTSNGELIIREHSKIDNSAIDKARMCGKLKELTEYSK